MVNPMETLASKLPKALVDKVDRLVASGRYANRSEVLRVAVRALPETGRPRETAKASPRISPLVQEFYKQLKELARDPRYRHRWVALHNGLVVDSDDNHDALIGRILEREEDPIHVGFATEDPEPPRYRMPSVRVRRRE